MVKILVADDDADIVSIVVQRLRSRGHRAQGVADAAEALAMVAVRGAPDLVVLDVTMPGMNGLDLLGRLRAETGVADLPGIFLSGRKRPADIQAGEALGARCLTKPFTAKPLIHAIDDIVTEIERKTAEARGEIEW